MRGSWVVWYARSLRRERESYFEMGILILLCSGTARIQASLEGRVIPVLGAALVPYIRDSPLARLIVSSISVLIQNGCLCCYLYPYHSFFWRQRGGSCFFALLCAQFRTCVLCAQFLDLRTHYGHTSCCFWSCERISGK